MEDPPSSYRGSRSAGDRIESASRDLSPFLETQYNGSKVLFAAVPENHFNDRGCTTDRVMQFQPMLMDGSRVMHKWKLM